MSNGRKKNNDPLSTAQAGDTAADQPKFEQALARLEAIVSEMESAELPLDEVIKRYEEGTRLARLCSRRLEEAEKKIEVLARQKDGSVVPEPFETASTPASTPPTAPKSKPREDNEGSLF